MERKEQGLTRYVVAVAAVVVPLVVVVAQQVERRYAEGVQRYVEAAARREARAPAGREPQLELARTVE